MLTWNGDISCYSLVHRSINRDIHHHSTPISVHPGERLGHCKCAGDNGGGARDPRGL